MEVAAYLSISPSAFDISVRDPKENGKALSHKASEREEIGCLISLLEN